MKIVWDERKRQINSREHEGLDFADLTNAFFENATISDTYSKRLKATGEFRGSLITVIFKPLGLEAVSIISMRPVE